VTINKHSEHQNERVHIVILYHLDNLHWIFELISNYYIFRTISVNINSNQQVYQQWVLKGMFLSQFDIDNLDVTSFILAHLSH